MTDTPTSKKLSEKDAAQVLQGVYNASGTISVDGFAVSKVGAKIVRTAVSSTIDDFRYLDVFHSEVASTTNTSDIIGAIGSLEFIRVGQYVFGTGIPANTTIIAIDPDAQEIQLSANATATGTPTLKFANLLLRLRITYDNASHDNVDDVERLD